MNDVNCYVTPTSFQTSIGKVSKIVALSTKTELKDFIKTICLKKSQVSAESISVCYVIENSVEHGRHCLPCYLPCCYINDVIDLSPYQLIRHIDYRLTSSGCHSAQVQ